jgi:hypothetical protein
LRYFQIWLVLLAALTMPAKLHAQAPDTPDEARTGADSGASHSAAPGAGAQSAEPGDTADGAQIPDRPAPGRENHKRLFGLGPRQYYVVDDSSLARPLTVKEKWHLYYRQTVNPYRFISTGVSAGIGQARDTFPDYGQGMEGYGKRYGAGIADRTLGSFFGSFLLPSLFHDDPRYFRMRSGSVFRRGIYAASRVLITRHDDGSRCANYPRIMGAFIGTGLGNLYYPESERGAGTTFVRGAGVLESAAVGFVFKEFWPDIRDKIFKKKKTEEDLP